MTNSTFTSREFNQDKSKESIVDLLAMPNSKDIDFEVPKIKGTIYRPEEFD